MPPIAFDTLDLPAEAQRIADDAHRMDDQSRRPGLLAITGIPGSGKSTLARRVVDRVNDARPGSAVLLPMDGFHLTDADLHAAGLHQQKGTPETFDAVGFLGLIQAIHREDYPAEFPVYDRTAHDPVWRPDDPAQQVRAEHELVVVEGNYLLLQREPWVLLHPLWDETWRLECPWPVARPRLIDRHMAGGRSRAEAQRKADEVDQANAQMILNDSIPADRVVAARLE